MNDCIRKHVRGRGRSAADNRRFVEAVLWIARTGPRSIPISVTTLMMASKKAKSLLSVVRW